MNALLSLLIFTGKAIILVAALLTAIAGIVAIASKGKQKNKGTLTIEKANDRFNQYQETLSEEILNKKMLKRFHKQQKKNNKNQEEDCKRIFLIKFNGDIRASSANQLCEEVTAILTVATPHDEVVVQLESGGGVIHGYGLCASQLARFREKGIPLTVAIDKVAASGGYMMACTADKIIAAPFAIIGSIGAVMQLPNLNRFLKKHNIDFEMVTAGQHKRTLTMFGENTDEDREKVQQELNDAHGLFKSFILSHRPQVDIDEVATGEHWFATQCIDKKLVDQIICSDDYLCQQHPQADIFDVKYVIKKTTKQKLAAAASALLIP